METNRRIEGIGHQVKGVILESLGVAIGDSKLAADGTAERAVGDLLNSTSPTGDRLIGIDTDRIMGIGHQIKGVLIQELGRVIGNPKLQADGIAERHAGKEQNIAGGGRDPAREVAEKRSAAVDAGEKTEPLQNESKP